MYHHIGDENILNDLESQLSHTFYRFQNDYDLCIGWDGTVRKKIL